MASQFFIGRKEDIEVYADNGNHWFKSAQIESNQPMNKEAPKNVQLDIIVVGAGIAGLSAAITLSRAGHNVTVLEKSKFKKEAGFMITISTNAIRVLDSFDFDHKRARGVDVNHFATFNAYTLENIATLPTRHHDLAQKNAPKTFYRPDLHNELKRIALLKSDKFKTPTMRLGAKVARVDIKLGLVTLEDGEQLAADLIIGADGERSLVKEQFKDGQLLRTAPYRVLRAIVPREKLLDDARDRAMMDITKNKFAIFMSMDRQVSWFEGRDGLLQDLEAGYVVSEGEENDVEMDPKKAHAKMLKKFEDFHPDIVRALKKAGNVSDWEINYSRPLPRLFKDKAALIGDAAHSMLPTTGQGGGQALEDVGCLGVVLSAMTSRSELESRLNLYEKVRKGRAGVIQALSGIVYGTEKEFAESRPRHPINKTSIRTPEEHMKYISSYDVLEASKKALEDSAKARANL